LPFFLVNFILGSLAAFFPPSQSPAATNAF
jgi:hypothetical protein